MRFFGDGKIEPLQDLLSEQLKKSFDFVKSKVFFDYNGVSGDIDVIAIKDNNVFVFECKNSMLPCNFFELRTSYDHILKGVEQLEKIKKLFENLNFIKHLEGKLTLKIGENINLFTCVVTGNRMFYGLRINDHPIRSIYELTSFLNTGEVSISIFDKDGKSHKKKFSLWKGNEFDVQDLIDNLEKDYFYKVVFESMLPSKKKYLEPISKIKI